jgi:hypothetical protein
MNVPPYLLELIVELSRELKEQEKMSATLCLKEKEKRAFSLEKFYKNIWHYVFA